VIAIEGVSHIFETKSGTVQALQDVNFEVEANEFVTLVGFRMWQVDTAAGDLRAARSNRRRGQNRWRAGETPAARRQFHVSEAGAAAVAECLGECHAPGGDFEVG
jgi:hypothetical protein